MRQKNLSKQRIRNREAVRKYYATPKGREVQRRAMLKTLYGITLEQWEQMFDEQKGLCAICLLPETRTLKGKSYLLTLGHNHETGKLRKLLCHKCNAGIGFLGESPDRLRAAARYLEENNRADD